MMVKPAIRPAEIFLPAAPNFSEPRRRTPETAKAGLPSSQHTIYARLKPWKIYLLYESHCNFSRVILLPQSRRLQDAPWKGAAVSAH